MQQVSRTKPVSRGEKSNCKFYVQKNQHATNFVMKEYKYNKFLKKINQDTLSFVKKHSTCNKFHEQKSACIIFREEKPTCNKFH